MLVRMLTTRRASADGVKTQTFLKGRAYEVDAAFAGVHFPDGTYELAEQAGGGVAHDNGEAPASTASNVPPPAISDKGKRRWLRRNGGA